MRNWKYLIAAAAIGLAAFLLYRTLSRYSLDQLVEAVSAVPVPRLLGAAGFAAASYLCLTCFDYLALRYVGKPLPYPKAALASFTALSLGHNIGLAALSSGAVRYRFYSRWGLSTGEVAKVIVFCGITVGLGLLVLGGAALLLRSGLAVEITGLSLPIVIILGHRLPGRAGHLPDPGRFRPQDAADPALVASRCRRSGWPSGRS